MTDGDSLLRAILELPEEDTPRLAYADYLDETGRPVRAEYIRVSIEVGRLGPATRKCQVPDASGTNGVRCGRCAGCLNKKEHQRLAKRQLLLKKRLLAAGEFAYPGVAPSCCVFSRGFVKSVVTTRSVDWVLSAEALALFTREPVVWLRPAVTPGIAAVDGMRGAQAVWWLTPRAVTVQYQAWVISVPQNGRGQLPAPLWEEFEAGFGPAFRGRLHAARDWEVYWFDDWNRADNALAWVCVNYNRRRAGLTPLPAPRAVTHGTREPA